jgi:hypothetical protein
MLSNAIDVIRIILVCAAFFFGYQIGFSGEVYDPAQQLNFMIPLVIAAVAGISGLEGLLYGDKAAEAKGYEKGSKYQKQSAIALLSYTFMAIVAYFANWGTLAELTVFGSFIFFFVFSGYVHALSAIRDKNFAWQNINRPFITLMLIAGMVYPVLMYFKTLP